MVLVRPGNYDWQVQVAELTTESFLQTWSKFYGANGFHSQSGVWRRTQSEANREKSGWTNPRDARRRLVQYEVRFAKFGGLASEVVRVEAFHLWIHLALPEAELDHELRALNRTISTSPNSPAKVTVLVQDRHPQDITFGRELPANYKSGDIDIELGPSFGLADDPWFILAAGFRRAGLSERPRNDELLEEFEAHAPYNVEVGSGMSVEAGLPMLSDLHETYSVEAGGRPLFLIGNLAHELITNPRNAISQVAMPFTAEFHVTRFGAFHALRALITHGLVLEPVFSHNFDHLMERSGIEVARIRRFDLIEPPVQFGESARGLLVIGSHADRRGVRRRAAEAGLQIYLIDTERFPGLEAPYPLEGSRRLDILCHQPAADALSKLASRLKIDDG